MSKIALTVAAVQALLGAVVLLGWWELTADQLAAIVAAVNAVMFAVAAWLDPSVPVGKRE